MSLIACPRCQTIRAPNGVLCHRCGYNYAERSEQPGWTSQSPGRPIEVTATFGTAFKFGAGFALGALVIGFVGGIVSTILLAGVFGAIMSSFMKAFGG